MRRERLVSFVSIAGLALALPILLRLVNSVSRFFVGAEGRLAAITVEVDRVLGPMPQPWRALAQGEEDLLDFMDKAGPQVAEVKTQYVRIDHIYDGFNVVNREDGNLKFDWTGLDRIVDKIRATGATPFLSLSYMPLAISKGDIVDEPKDWNEWALTVQRTIEYYSGEKGIANVYYEVWNEPDLFGKWTMGGNKDYKKLYLYASRGAQAAQVSQTFKFGGPATTGLYKNWLDRFFPFILENQLRLDFFSWHRYDANGEKYNEDVENAQQWIESHPYFLNVEKVISKMGPDSEKSGQNDTRAGAAHLLAVTRELLFKIKYGFTFSITGPWGIINKPRYEALKLLSRLGDQRLAVTGDGTWVKSFGAKNGDTYQVLIVNYDPKESHSEVVPVTFVNLADQNFLLRQITMNGATLQNEIATTEAILQREIPMTPNSAVLLELTPR